MGITIARKYIRELCKKFPDSPNLTLAKKAFKDEPKLFTCVDHARTMVRLERGATGDRNRSITKDKSNFKQLGWQNELPESLAVPTKVWRLPKGCKKVLMLFDIHLPFHDKDALQTALEYGKEKGVDAIFIGGDMMDFYRLSFHENDPRKCDIADELEMGREFLKYLRSNFDCPIYFTKGNHEYRLERYLMVKAPELLNISDFDLSTLLRFGEHGVTEVPYMGKIYFGKLLIEHGDKMRGAGGVNPARTLLLRFKRAVICGHFHRHSEATQRVYDGDIQKAWSVGCLCELEPKYFPVNDWSHGAAIIEVDHSTGNYVVDNFQIINGKVYK
jgi:predicted phosphodiesterase